jgi:two-component system phosphate regulon sensor histidine kinase PhoR
VLATLVPTILLIATGIVLLAIGNDTPSLVAGVLVLAFCTTSLTGYILGSIFMNRGAQVARFQNDFLSSVSHELRTPLTSIGIFIETLQDERLTDPKRKSQCLDLLSQEIQRLQGLVERLLHLSKIESGNHRFKRSVVDVSALIRDSIAAFDAASIHDSTKIRVQEEPNLWVIGDAQALSQAISNLLVNAWKYTPKESREISIETKSLRKHVEVIVRDNGPGIPRDEQKQIFSEFERGRDVIDDRTKRGSGLGLAIVLAIVRAHKGRVDLKSRPGQGSEFRIRLRAA